MPVRHSGRARRSPRCGHLDSRHSRDTGAGYLGRVLHGPPATPTFALGPELLGSEPLMGSESERRPWANTLTMSFGVQQY